MNFADTLAKSQQLDRALARPLGGESMPEIGGGKLAGEIGAMMSDVRKLIDDTKLDIAAAVTELSTEIQAGKQVAKAIRSEAAQVRQAFGAVLGNAPPDETASETTQK